MGVLTTRVQGSITAITAMAAASIWSEVPEKSPLRSISYATGQTLLLSSIYAPVAASTFDADFSLMSPTSSMSPPSGLSRTPSASVSHSIQHYKAKDLKPVRCDLDLNLFIASNHSQYAQHPSPVPEIMKTYKNIMNLSEAHSTTSNLFAYARAMPSRVHSHAVRSSVNALHPVQSSSSISSLVHAFRLEDVFRSNRVSPPLLSSISLLHTWHLPLNSLNKSASCGQGTSSSTTVVLLGWLGAEHRHLKKYAEWYTSRGMHAVTFIVPMKDLFTLDAVDKAEKHVDILTGNLVNWIKEDVEQGNDKHLIFHTFSNTGWLTYGAVLERLMEHGDDFLNKIKGCVVDSAPAAKPDPQVWASGFSAALLKKNSVASQKLQTNIDGSIVMAKPSMTETALLTMLENFFCVLFQVPHVNRKLTHVVSVLSNQQPACPQLYIYSSADVVIPVTSVEAFIEEQKKAGRMVRACNFESSPHVDHFRSHPDKYSEQLASFLKVCMPQWVH